MAEINGEHNVESDGEQQEEEDKSLAFSCKRHTESIEGVNAITQTWRMKERMKTVSVALVLCLNVGVDPPDIVKTQPCARLECWIDPLSMSSQKALENIGANLQKQYERWQPRARYKQSLDPTVDEVKKLCSSLRRNAKEERVLLHYNGHGVPRPTANGEVWVFNRTYTQYIPLSVYDLQAWMGSPSIYVYDCSNAGMIVKTFKNFADQHEKEYEQLLAGRSATPPPSFKNCIQLAACAENQVLPMNPELPADLFTSCLTTPIKIALRWYVMQNTSSLVPSVTLDLIEKIPGMLNDRRTMLGELNWIFTAITDTIAWNTLPRDLFQKLFRQDLLVASLFRNFLLAERIMRSYDCTPVSSPSLPPTYQHPMWQAWDLALDLCLGQLPAMLENEEPFEHSYFFEEQLTAFQVWLELGSELRSPPEQLPIVLQVLLSQVHRVRALDLLGRFLDLGPWAVNLALSVGIFPYVLKLLQSSARELRPLLVFIWAKILAVDSTCQADLVRDNGHKYFLSVLQDPTMTSEHRTMAAFVLACVVQGHLPGQELALQGSLVSICLEQLGDPLGRLRQWLALALGRLWSGYEAARWCGVRDSAHEKLYQLLKDPIPEVRASAVYALGTFIASTTERSEHANKIDHSVAVTLIATVGQDMSPLVRKELIGALQWMVLLFEGSFCTVAQQQQKEDTRNLRDGALSPQLNAGDNHLLSPVSGMRRIASRDRLKMLSPSNLFGLDAPVGGISIGEATTTATAAPTAAATERSSTNLMGSVPSTASIYVKLWNALVALEQDAHPEVAAMAKKVTDHVKNQVRESLAHKEINENKLSASPAASPSGRVSFMVSESPPTINSLHEMQLPRHSAARPNVSRTRKNVPVTISEEGTTEGGSGLHPIVGTQFVEWSARYFAQPEECAKALSTKLETQYFQGRNPSSPTTLALHPYETLLAVAGKDYFSVWDWQQGVKVCYCSNRNPKGARITSLDYLNGEEANALLLVGADDGSLKVWRNISGNNRDNKEPSLVTAWQGLLDTMVTSNIPSPQRAASGTAGLVVAWEQQQQQLAVAGDLAPRLVRLWDVEREMRLRDLPTGSDSCVVTCLAPDLSGGSLLAAGCADGSVRLFDRRLSSQEARVMTWREHSGWVVAIHLRPSAGSSGRLISGCVAGDKTLINCTVSNSSRHDCNGSSFYDRHIFGSVSQYINVHPFPGTTPKGLGTEIGSLRYQEGFRGQRLGPAACLAFHPLRMMLAAGSVDSSIRVYGQEHPRR
ncbi:hypothetical protein B566_EDAN007563 [Ephemera danica]|nr:hypothetical protein B566_EDAN007563 [Ephemera danica]